MWGFSVEAELIENADRQDELCCYVSRVEDKSVAMQNGKCFIMYFFLLVLVFFTYYKAYLLNKLYVHPFSVSIIHILQFIRYQFYCSLLTGIRFLFRMMMCVTIKSLKVRFMGRPRKNRLRIFFLFYPEKTFELLYDQG